MHRPVADPVRPAFVCIRRYGPCRICERVCYDRGAIFTIGVRLTSGIRGRRLARGEVACRWCCYGVAASGISVVRASRQ